MRYKVQYRAEVEAIARAGFAARSVSHLWVTVSPKPLRRAVAERVAQGFRVSNADALVRVVEA